MRGKEVNRERQQRADSFPRFDAKRQRRAEGVERTPKRAFTPLLVGLPEARVGAEAPRPLGISP